MREAVVRRGFLIHAIAAQKNEMVRLLTEHCRNRKIFTNAEIKSSIPSRGATLSG